MHPLTLVCVGLLVINDWVLKPRYHGFVTGKLSDIAGLTFAPLILPFARRRNSRRGPPRRTETKARERCSAVRW